MDMRELRSFIVLAEHRHFGRAAQVLHLSQPALTKQIRKMEEELGSPLFERSRHGSQLSAFGRQFLREARGVAEKFDQLLNHGRMAASGESGLLRIGFGFHTLELVPRLVVSLRRLAPGVEISLKDMSTAEQADALALEQIDLGFLRLPVGREFASLPVNKDSLMLVSAEEAGYPERVSLKECRHESFVTISRERSPSFHNHVLMLCARHGFHPRIVQEVSEVTSVLALVRAGLGLGFIPQSFDISNFMGIRYHPIRDAVARWNVGAAWRKSDTNPALHKFLVLLRQELATRPIAK